MHDSLFPVFLKLETMTTLVVGAGQVGERKALALLACGSKVFVVAPEATPTLLSHAAAGLLTLERRPFAPDDLVRFAPRLVFAATSDRRLNRVIAAAARAAGLFVNVADTPELCDFYLPAVLARGPLKIAVSSGGAAPSLAKALRDELALQVSPDWDGFLRLVAQARGGKSWQDLCPAKREALLDEARSLWFSGYREEATKRLNAHAFKNEADDE